MNLVSENNLDNLIMVMLIIAITITPLIYLPYHGETDLYQISMNEFLLMKQDTVDKPKIEFLLLLEIIILLVVFIRIRNYNNFFQWDNSYPPLLTFLFLIIISTALSQHLFIAIYGKPYRSEGLLAYIAYIVIFFLFANFIDSENRLKTVLKYLFISGFIISLYGLIQFFGMDFIINVESRQRVYATLGNPNFAGSYIMLLLPIVLVLYMTSNQRKQSYIMGLLSTVYYAFMVATSTRSAWVSFIVIIPLIIYYIKDYLVQNLSKLIIILLIFVLVTAGLNGWHQGGLKNRFLSLFYETGKLIQGSEEERGSVGSNRLFIYKTSLPLLWERPLFGSGLDTFHKVYPQELYEEFTGRRIIVDKAHSEYLQLGVTVGIPALIAYLWFLFTIISKGMSYNGRNKYQIALFMSFTAYIIQATFNISVVSVAPVFWAITGLNVAVRRN